MGNPLDDARKIKAAAEAARQAEANRIAQEAEAARVAAANAEAARQAEANRIAQEAEPAKVQQVASDNNVPKATIFEDKTPIKEVIMDSTATSVPPTVTTEATAKTVGVNLPIPNISNNNILAQDDKYSLVDKASLDAKWSIDTKDVWKKAGYIYGVLDNDIYSDRSSKEHLKVDEDNLTAKLVEDVQNGLLNFNRDDGTFKYTPNQGFSGEDQFTYQVCKSSLCSNVATVTITMKNYAPKVKDDAYSIREDTVLNADTPKGILAKTGFITYGVLNNDEDKNKNQLSAELIFNVKHGSLDFYKDGTFKYTPNKGYFGKDDFTYKVYDGIEYSLPAKATITVERNNPPQAVNDKYEMKQGKVLNADRVKDTTGWGQKLATYGVLSNDVDSNKDPLTATLVEGPKHGSLDFHKDGTFSYRPDSSYSGDDYFTYMASDGTLQSNLATAYIVINQFNGEL